VQGSCDVVPHFSWVTLAGLVAPIMGTTKKEAMRPGFSSPIILVKGAAAFGKPPR